MGFNILGLSTMTELAYKLLGPVIKTDDTQKKALSIEIQMAGGSRCFPKA
jgi:hypothetical protein